MKENCLEGMSNMITDDWNLYDVLIDIYYPWLKK